MDMCNYCYENPAVPGGYGACQECDDYFTEEENNNGPDITFGGRPVPKGTDLYNDLLNMNSQGKAYDASGKYMGAYKDFAK